MHVSLTLEIALFADKLITYFVTNIITEKLSLNLVELVRKISNGVKAH